MEMIFKICKHHVCKKIFSIDPNDGRSAKKEYCNHRCRESAGALRYYRKNPRKLVKKQPKKKIVVCEFCNMLFLKEVKCGMPPKYCSTLCRRSADKKRRADGMRNMVKYKKLCKKCWMCFETYRDKQEYCSQLCFAKRDELKRRYCVICNKTFKPSGKKVLCCSLVCSGIKGGNTNRIYEPGDPRKKISKVISDSIYVSLKSNGGSKRGRKWESLVNFTRGDLIKHLEKQFKPGMSWENHGRDGWHIDHIIPISAHNFKSVKHQDFKKCWSLKNLQPLWAKDNLSKHARLKKPFQPSLLI